MILLRAKTLCVVMYNKDIKLDDEINEIRNGLVNLSERGLYNTHDAVVDGRLNSLNVEALVKSDIVDIYEQDDK